MNRPKQTILTILLSALLACAHAPAVAQGNAIPSGTESSATSGAPSTSGSSQSAPGTTTITIPMIILMPVEAQEDPKLNNGCWVRLVDKDAMPKKGNDVLTVVGRMYMPSFETPSGVNWSQKADSLVVGPNARVSVFSDKNYKGSSAKLIGGQQVKDISKELGFVKSIDSIQVDCAS